MANFSGTLLPTVPAVESRDLVSVYDGQIVNINAPVQFAQRVWSTGSVPPVWCYYIGPINAAPLATETTPNWVGSAIRHEVLGPV